MIGARPAPTAAGIAEAVIAIMPETRITQHQRKPVRGGFGRVQKQRHAARPSGAGEALAGDEQAAIKARSAFGIGEPEIARAERPSGADHGERRGGPGECQFRRRPGQRGGADAERQQRGGWRGAARAFGEQPHHAVERTGGVAGRTRQRVAGMFEFDVHLAAARGLLGIAPTTPLDHLRRYIRHGRPNTKTQRCILRYGRHSLTMR